MAGIFKFKQFSVDQSGCAMKINTDGVLLGAFVEAGNPEHILDIGTGTGVIALMLAQKFAQAHIDAVEVDGAAARTAALNFEGSPFSNRLSAEHTTFQQYFKQYPGKKYDLIISNPPFYLHSLEAPDGQMNLAKHTDALFFEELITDVSNHLNRNGNCWLILPVKTAELVKTLLPQYGLYLNKIISIRSFSDSIAHREIIVFSPSQATPVYADFIIYNEPKRYTAGYINMLKDFFTIF